mgnify:CR=1 FL=1
MTDGLLKVSWSALRMWEECRQKQHLMWTGKGKATDRMLRTYLPGTVADLVMREWLQSGDPQPGQMVEAVEEVFDRYVSPKTDAQKKDAGVVRWKGDPNKDKESVKKFVRELVVKLEPILFDLVVPYDYQPEKSFSVRVNIPGLEGAPTPILLRGGIDIVVRPKRFQLWDLKATSDASYVKKVLGQGVFYDLAWGLLFEPPESFGFIVPMCAETVVRARITEEDRTVMMSRVISFAHAQWRGEWYPKVDDVGCNSWCPVSHACEKFKAPTF